MLLAVDDNQRSSVQTESRARRSCSMIVRCRQVSAFGRYSNATSSSFVVRWG